MGNVELQRGRRTDEDGRALHPSHVQTSQHGAGLHGYDTPSSRALRVALARAFPVRIAPMREALVSGSITKLARP